MQVLWEIATRRCPYAGMQPIQAAMAVLHERKRPDHSLVPGAHAPQQLDVLRKLVPWLAVWLAAVDAERAAGARSELPGGDRRGHVGVLADRAHAPPHRNPGARPAASGKG